MRLTARQTERDVPKSARRWPDRIQQRRRTTGEILRLVLALLIAIGLVLGIASPASAHTGFESSDPADGEEVEGPVNQITIVFTGDAEPAGSGFEVLEQSGVVRAPTAAESSDGRTWVLSFDPALEAGTVGVRWSVAAPDTHPISGSFSFTALNGAEPPAPPVAEQDAVEQDTAANAPASSLEGSAEPATDTPAVETLDSFLASDTQDPSWAVRLGSIGRILTMIGALFGIGALVFSVTSLRGSRREVGNVVYWIRRSGLLVLLGAGVELIGALGVEAAGDVSNMWSPTVFSAVVWGSTGIAIGLRILGGVGLVMGPKMTIAPAEHVADPVISLRELTRVGAGSAPMSSPGSPEGQVSERPEPVVNRTSEWALSAAGSIGAFLGGAVLLLSFAFDGHTVAKGNRLLMGVVDVLHVGAGAVWFGGVVMLTILLWGRHRRGRDLEALPLVIRFSVVASVALVVVGVAGVAMTVMILDAPSQLWATPWGRLLLAKTAFVVLAAAGGAYNHRVLVPQLERRGDEGTSNKLRAVVTGESAALIVVAVLTAFLVAAGT